MSIAIPELSPRAESLLEETHSFLQDDVLPAEAEHDKWESARGPDDRSVPPVLPILRDVARKRGLWNLFLPSVSGLTQREYAAIAELSGWSNDLAPAAMNCQAPDTGNME